MDKKQVVHDVCNGRPCFSCPLFAFCVRFEQKKGDALADYENRFYSGAFAELQRLGIA